jgi:hypothetical protein
MRSRPIRPNVYLPVVRFGVISSDWKFVLAAALIGYTVPFLFDLKLWGVPLELWTGLGAAALAVAFFNWARVGRRPYWLQHKIRALAEKPRQRRVLPRDELKQPARRWVINR